MKLLTAFAAALAVVAVLGGSPVRADDAANTDAADSNVLVLDKDSFGKVVDPEKLMLVEFYAPWCGHCKALAPEYEKAATTLKPDGIKLAKVDCTSNTDLCNQYEVQGFPTMKVFREGKPSEYGGGRTEDTIVRYMRKQALPALSLIKADEIEAFTKKDRFVAVAYLPTADAAERKTIESLAEKHRDDYTFALTTDADAAKELGVAANKPALVAFRTFDEPKATYDGKVDDAEALAAWLKRESIPTMDDVTPENYMSYVESGLPLAFFFYDTPEDKATIGPQIEAVARSHKGKINFVYCDAAKFGAHAETLNLKVGTWPAFAINEIENALKWPFDQSKQLTEASVRDFVDKYAKGQIDPSLKSEPIPEKQEGPVTVVVGKSFKDIVLDQSKDVFIEFYAPWCGHCKKLAPTWDELATTFKDQSDKIVIAKLDATENDLPPASGPRLEGFPTMRLYRAKDNELFDYQGDRSLEDLLSFVKKNAGNEINVEIPEKKQEKKEEDKTEEEPAREEL